MGVLHAYLTVMDADAPQRVHDLRAVFDGVRFVVRTGSQWRQMPHDLPPWAAVYQQMWRWAKAGVFEAMAHKLRAVARIVAGRDDVVPTAVILDSRTLHSTREAAHALVTTWRSAAKAARCTSRWTPSAICSPCT